MGMLADAAWTQPLDIARATEMVRFVAAPGGHLGWIEGRRTFARVTIPGKVRRTQLKRPWRTAAIDARGRALTVTTVTSRRPCRGKRSYRVYVEVRRDGAPVQRLGDGCRNIGGAVLAVNARGDAVLGWLEIPSGAKWRLVVATGSTTRPMRARWNSGRGDAAGHAVALNADGAAVVAYRRGSRLLARVRPAGGSFGRAQDLGATHQRASPMTVAAVDETGVTTVAWTDDCACGEAGFSLAPNPLRAARSSAAGRFGATQTLDDGRDVARPPALAAGAGAAVVTWGTENGGEGNLTAVAPPGGGFGAPTKFEFEGLFPAIDRGVPTLVTSHRAWRLENGAWTVEPVGASGFARALLTEPDGRLALITQDGDRLRVSYRSG